MAVMERAMPQGDVKLTKSQKKALELLEDGPAAPTWKGIRSDVGQRLWDAGFIEASMGAKSFNRGYTVCRLTAKGRAVLADQWP